MALIGKGKVRKSIDERIKNLPPALKKEVTENEYR